jgi:hypothetical protein
MQPGEKSKNGGVNHRKMNFFVGLRSPPSRKVGRSRTETETAFMLRMQDSNFAVDFEGLSRVMILLFDEDQTVYFVRL